MYFKEKKYPPVGVRLGVGHNFSWFFFFFQVRGTDYPTKDGTCIRDYIDVSDLIDAHVKALAHATRGKVGIYNVGTGKGNLLT